MQLTIKQWMALKEITVKQLSEASGISEATICHLRTKKTKPNLDTLQKVTKALGINLADVEV